MSNRTDHPAGVYAVVDSTGVGGDCSCPVCRGGRPPTLPLGVPFANRVNIREVPARTAAQVIQAHHSYVPELVRWSLTTAHGVFLDDHLVGVITYRRPMWRSFTPGRGEVPDQYRQEYDKEDAIVVNRVCIAVSMANLASCSLARSVAKYVQDRRRRDNLRLLMTWVRDDYDGSMFRALSDAGWYEGVTVTGHQAGNRPVTEIRDYDKTRWLYPVAPPDMTEQTGLPDYGGGHARANIDPAEEPLRE